MAANNKPKTKTEYVGMRMSQRDKELLQKASDFYQMSMTDYVLHLVRIDAEHMGIRLDSEEEKQ